MPETGRHLSHLDSDGQAKMVDVSDKQVSERVAVARAVVRMQPSTLSLIDQGGHKKGDVIAVARVAGIQAAKKCADLIPLCHPLLLSRIDVEIALDPASSEVNIIATCGLSARTGVEMEAMTAASIAALTIYDMCKGVDRGMSIRNVELVSKTGGRSGNWQRAGTE